jgi:hypothetical protein
MNKDELISTTQETNGDILIKVPIDLVVFAMEYHPEFPVSIKNKKSISDYLVENIVFFGRDSDGRDESLFQRLLEECVFAAIEDAVDGVEFIDNNDWGFNV